MRISATNGESEQWDCMERLELLIRRRRPVRPVADEIGGRRANGDIPMAPEALPERSEGESERDLRKVDSGKGQN